MRRNNEAFTTHLAPDDAESQEVTIKQNTKRASTGRCHACNKFNRNHPRTCCKGTTSDFTSLAMAQQSLVRMCSFFEFCKKSLRDWHLKCLGNPKPRSWDFDDLSNCLSIWATFQVQSGYLEPGPAQIFLEPWEDFGTPFCSIHKALTPEVGWSCLGLAEGYQALEAPTSKAHRTSAFWVRHLDVTNRNGHGLLMFIDVYWCFIVRIKEKIIWNCETARCPWLPRSTYTERAAKSGTLLLRPSFGRSHGWLLRRVRYPTASVCIYLSICLYTNCDISVISISYKHDIHYVQLNTYRIFSSLRW